MRLVHRKIDLLLFLFVSFLSAIFPPTYLAEAGQSRESLPGLKASFVFSGTAEIDGCTAIFVGTVAPDDFFEKLAKTKTPSGEIFTIGSKEVKFFPETFTVSLIVSGPTPYGRHGCTKLGDDAMKSLTFGAQWKRGMTMRAVHNLVLGPSAILRKVGTMTACNYTLTFKDQDVPLSDHLILNVFNADGRLIARLSAQL